MAERVPGDVLAVHDRIAALPEGTVVIHGAARGADTLAGGNAELRGLTVEKYPARWSEHGSQAGHIRNDQMLDANPTRVVAFWDGTSPGTGSMIAKTKRRGIPVEVVTRPSPADHGGGDG